MWLVAVQREEQDMASAIDWVGRCYMEHQWKEKKTEKAGE